MSDDLPVDDDPVVRTALQRLPVPPHHDDFWARLDHRLAADRPERPRRAAPLGSGDPTPPDDLDEPGAGVVDLAAAPSLAAVPPVLRRRSNAALLMAAAAAAVIAVVAGTTLIRQHGGVELDTSESAQPQPEIAEGTSTTSAAAPPAGAAADDVDASSDAVLRWVAALGEADGEAAWAALGPASRDELGSRATFDDRLSALAEGYGSWSATTPERILVTPLGTQGGDTLVIVTLVGEVAPEGMPERRADAFPVRIVEGVAQLEPFADAGSIELVVPEPQVVPPGGDGPLVEGDELVVVVPDGAGAPILRLDDAAPIVCGEAAGSELTPLDGLAGQRCSYRPEGGIAAGPRLLTVALASADGARITATSVLFSAG